MSLAVQWLGLSTFIAAAPGSISGWGTKILQAARCRPPKKDTQKFYFILKVLILYVLYC